jgi:flagellar basal-body rod modification protein FlgD
MSIIGLEPVTTTGSEFSESQSKVMDKDDFLSLLITQLQHQDPLNPTDSVEFTAQLAQFSSLEQLANVNDNLRQLQNFEASINNSQAVRLIGKEITANGNFLKLTAGDSVGCDFKLDQNAALVVVTIYDASGAYIKSLESQDLTAGQHQIVWDGTDKEGNPVPDGNYTFEVLAADADGGTVGTSTFFSGIVDKIMFENNITYVFAGDNKIALGDVVQVAAPENPEESE